MRPIGPVAILLRHMNASPATVRTVAAISAAGVVAGLALLVR